MQMKTPWMEVALKELGVHETAGPKATARIIEYHAATDGKGASDELSWCGAFASWVLVQAGRAHDVPLGSAAARRWLTVGDKVAEPQYGDLVVYTRPGAAAWQGHVGFVTSADAVWVHDLAGNVQNAVRLERRERKLVLGFRRLPPEVLV